MSVREKQLKESIEQSLSFTYLEAVQQAILGYVHSQLTMEQLGVDLAKEFSQYPDLYLTALLQKVGIYNAKSKLPNRTDSLTLELVIDEIIKLPVIQYQYIAKDNLEKLSFSVIS